MAKKLIFLSNNHSGSLKLNFSVMVLVLGLIGYGFFQLGPKVFEQNGTSVIAPKNKVNGGKAYSVLLPNNLTTRQHELLSFAYSVAKSDGYKNPEYLQGLILQESGAGGTPGYRVAGDPVKKENQYYGVGQIKIAAALDVLKNFPELWGFLQTRTMEELQARLILDDHFNIRVASKYLLLMGVNKSASFALTAYNKGIGGAQNIIDHANFEYTKGVVNYASSSAVKQVNKKL